MKVSKWCSCEKPGSCGYGPIRCMKCGLNILQAALALKFPKTTKRLIPDWPEGFIGSKEIEYREPK